MYSQLIQNYFPEISETQKYQLQQLPEIYRYWNNMINVVSRKDIDNLMLHHIVHSLAISKIIHFKPNTMVLDVGTGGGFPGIPLAIIFPESRFHLIDAIAKKIKVVNEVIKTINLKNVTSQHTRIENLKTKYDFIIGRAITKFNDFVLLVKKNINQHSNHKLPNGIFYLKGNDIEIEKKTYQNLTIYSISDYFDEDYFKTKKIIYLPLTNKP